MSLRGYNINVSIFHFIKSYTIFAITEKKNKKKHIEQKKMFFCFRYLPDLAAFSQSSSGYVCIERNVT